MMPCKQDAKGGIIPDQALADYLQQQYGPASQIYLETGECGTYTTPGVRFIKGFLAGSWVFDDGAGPCGYGDTPIEAIHNGQDWLGEDMPTVKVNQAKTYWIETTSTASIIMTTAGTVVFVGTEKWRPCMGQTIHKALTYLQRKEGRAKIRKTLPAHYLTLEGI